MVKSVIAITTGILSCVLGFIALGVSLAPLSALGVAINKTEVIIVLMSLCLSFGIIAIVFGFAILFINRNKKEEKRLSGGIGLILGIVGTILGLIFLTTIYLLKNPSEEGSIWQSWVDFFTNADLTWTAAHFFCVLVPEAYYANPVTFVLQIIGIALTITFFIVGISFATRFYKQQTKALEKKQKRNKR